MDYKLNLTPSPQDNRDFVFKTQEIVILLVILKNLI